MHAHLYTAHAQQKISHALDPSACGDALQLRCPAALEKAALSSNAVSTKHSLPLVCSTEGGHWAHSDHVGQVTPNHCGVT